MKAWKKNEMWQQIIRKLREKKLSECENWGKLGWDGLGKVQEGLFMREVSWPSPPQQSIQKIHKFKYTNKIHKYKYTNTGGVPRTQRQITANACYQAVIQIITVPPYPDHSSCYQYAYSNLVKILNQWKSEKGWMQIQNLIKPWGRWGENLRGILLLGPDSSDKIHINFNLL